MKKDTILERIGHELKVNPPKVLAQTANKFGAGRAESQRKAIMLSKMKQRYAQA